MISKEEALKKITEAYYVTRSWGKGTPWFKRFLDEARNPDDQANAAAALMEAYIAQGKFDATLALLPQLVGDSPARYKLQLNVALMEAGDKLSEAKRFNESMLMYRMVLTVDEILVWQQARLADLQSQLNLLRLTTTTSDRAVELETEIFNTQAQIDALRKLKPYTAELKLRIARTYLLTGRDWESFYAYLELIESYPNHPNVEDFLYAAFSAATELNLTSEVIRLGEKSLADPKFKKYQPDVAIKLAQFYLEDEDYDSFYILAQDFITQNPDNRYAAQFVFLLGSAYVKQQRIDELVTVFGDYLKRYKQRPVREGSLYWVGLGNIFLGDYVTSEETFSTILNEYGDGPYAEDALYRRGICYFGLQQYELAEKDFKDFIKKYPDSKLRGETEYFLGDIYATLANVNQALKHYDNVEKYTDNASYIRNAYFQKGKLFEANERYGEMAQNFQQYMNKYRQEGDLTGALYELGRARELQGRPHEMLSEYYDGIMRFGNDPMAYGIDQILNAYAEKYESNRLEIDETLAFLRKLKQDKAFRDKFISDRAFMFSYFEENPNITMSVQEMFYPRDFRDGLKKDMAPVDSLLATYEQRNRDFPKETPAQTFSKAYEKATAEQQQTLALRLAMALDRLGDDSQSGRLFTERDVVFASPETLMWIGQSVEDYDPNLATKAYTTVVDSHPAAEESVLGALLALGDLNLQLEDYDQAIYYYTEAEKLFPADPAIVRAVLGKGNALLASKQYNSAREEFEKVVSRRDWRGEPQAEALFKIGLTYYDQQQWDKAQAYFQRVYIGFFAFVDWASAAYYYSGQALLKMGGNGEGPSPREQARNTYEEFLANDAFRNSEYYAKIKDAMTTL